MFFINSFIPLLGVFFISKTIIGYSSIVDRKAYFFVLIFISLLLFFLDKFDIADKGIYLIYILSFISIFFYINKKLFKKQDIYLFFILLLLLFFLKDLYLNDEDELAYWGLKSKFFFFKYANQISEYITANLYLPKHHSEMFGLYHLFFLKFNDFREDILILANLTLLISSFSYLINIKKNLFCFLIFIFLSNCFSFGLLSIYVDPIVALCFAILIYEFYVRGKNFNFVNLLIILFFFLIHRISLLFLLLLILFKSKIYLKYLIKIKKRSLILILSLILLIIFSSTEYFSRIIDIFEHFFQRFNENNISFIDFISQYFLYFYNILSLEVYFLKFGLFINTLLKIMNIGFSIPELNFQLWFLLIVIITLLSIQKSNGLLYFYIFGFLIISFCIFALKVYLVDNTTYKSTLRYYMIYNLSFVLVLLKINSSKITNLKIYPKVIIFLLFIMIIPNKTFTLIAPKKIYLLDIQNSKIDNIRKKISLIPLNTFFDKNIEIINQEVVDPNISLVNSLIQFNFYPFARSRFNETIIENRFKNLEKTYFFIYKSIEKKNENMEFNKNQSIILYF